MDELFSTKERIKLLENIIYKTSAISAASLASGLKLSKGLVSKYMGILLKNGFVKKGIEGIFTVAKAPSVKAVKILLNLDKVDASIFKKYSFVKAAGIYGSCAKGENTEESDVDMWIKVNEAGDRETAALSAALTSKIKGVKPLFLTDNKLKDLKDKDKVFYHSLFFGSIIIYGGINDISV